MSKTGTRRFVFWSILVVLQFGILCRQIDHGIAIETNVLSLLPATEQDPLVEAALQSLTAQVSRSSIFLVGYPDAATAAEAAIAFAAGLRASGEFINIRCEVSADTERAFFEHYFPYRYQFLSSSSRALLAAPDGGRALVQASERSLYTPFSAMYTPILERDPLLLFPAFVQSFPRLASRAFVSNGVLMTEENGVLYGMVTAESLGSPFARTDQHRITAAIDGVRSAVQATHQGITLLESGAIRFAKAGSDVMQREISLISTGSMIGVLVLMLFVFRSPVQLLMGMLPILIGCLYAFTISCMIFPEIHLLTLVFGASLIGVCIDYSFHYLCEHFLGSRDDAEWTVLRKIFSGITLGAITSAMGYIGFVFAPFPGLRQIAVFSAIGLIGAYVTVVFWYPFLLRNAVPRPSRLPDVARRALALVDGLRRNRRWWILAVPAAIFTTVGLLRLNTNDDIRQLQHLPAHLMDDERRVRELAGRIDSGRFFLVRGENDEAVLQKEEALLARLNVLQEDGALAVAFGITNVAPSRKLQQQDHDLLRRQLVESGALDAYVSKLGFTAEVAQQTRDAIVSPLHRHLSVEAWLASPVSTGLRHLWIQRDNGEAASLVILGGIRDPGRLEELESNVEGVHYIDKVEDISQLLGRYRHHASGLVAVSYAAIFLLLIVRYRPLRAIAVMAPPLVAAVVALATSGIVGAGLNLFGVLALMLVLGIGIDYSIFFAETRTGREITMLAIAMSALTTILSFGLLASSRTPVLRSFGMTVLVGIALAFLLAPLVTGAFRADDMSDSSNGSSLNETG